MSDNHYQTYPKFLYSGVVKKVHKRSHTRYQKRRLEFYSDRVDYYKLDADKRSGTIPIAGVRVEIRLDYENHFEFVYDDIKDRQYVFVCDADVVKASMLWIANGEQHNNYGSTLKKLRPETLSYMMNMQSHSIIRELTQKKYKQASIFFATAGHAITRDYEDMDSMGLENRSKIPTDTSSSDDESQSSSFTDKGTKKQLTLKLVQGAKSFDMLEREGYMTACQITQSEKQGKFVAQRGTPSLERSEEDPAYMSFPELAGLRNKGLNTLPTTSRQCSETFLGESERGKSKVRQRHNITYNYSNNNDVGFGSREVNAVKARICGQVDFIEIDMGDLGQTLYELHCTLCNELDITQDEIVCIRKLPDIRIRNDNDVRRIRAGRTLEVEIRDI